MIVNIAFCLSADNFSLEEITKKIGINPTSTRTKDSFPSFGLPHTEWVLELEEKECRAISIMFDKMFDILSGKEKIIRILCEKYNLEPSFVFVVHAKECIGPELVLTRNNIAFASSINAEIGFDLYYNEGETYLD